MMHRYSIIGISVLGATAIIAIGFYLMNTPHTPQPSITDESAYAVAYFAGGCFWCVESDLEKLPAVADAISGYMGGTSENPTYGDYAEGGHREVVKVLYDPAQTSYADLVWHLIRHIDPTDSEGSFYDRGSQYSSAVYYQTDEERDTARAIIAEVDASGRFERPLTIPVLPATTFYPAEEYHQEYAERHPLKYGYYRNASGRDDFIETYWGDAAEKETEPINTPPQVQDTTTQPVSNTDTGMPADAPWHTFAKTDDEALRTKLTPLEYNVTQEEGTERAYENEYWNLKEEGIYVDRISGEPLFASTDKYDSGTGWPSFTKPLYPQAVTEHEDNTFFSKRTEVRSAIADSHLGHVFPDGPQEAGGLRYCMNSAALRFIPKDELAGTPYERYATLFASTTPDS